MGSNTHRNHGVVIDNELKIDSIGHVDRYAVQAIKFAGQLVES